MRGDRSETRPTLWEQLEHDRRVAYALLVLFLPFELIPFLVIGSPLFLLAVLLITAVDPLFFGTSTPYMLLRLLGVLALCALATAPFLLRGGARRILMRLGGIPVPTGEMPHVRAAMHDMCLAAGIRPVPELWLIDVSAVNALAVGVSPRKQAIALTTGLVDALSVAELRYVMAHLLARIASGDTAVATFRASVIPALPSMGDEAWISGHPGAILQELVSALSRFGTRKRTERSLELADERGMLLLREPDAALSAMRAITAHDNAWTNLPHPVATLFFTWPGCTGDPTWEDQHNVRRLDKLVQLRHEPISD